MNAQIKVGVLIVDPDKALLIKEWSKNKQGYYWNFIKGTFDNVLDKSLIDCAKREANEEAGAPVSINRFINIVIKHGFNTRIYINLVGSLKGKPHIASKSEQASRGEEITEMRWFTKVELKNMKENEFINDVVFEAINKWIESETYPLSILTEANLNN